MKPDREIPCPGCGRQVPVNCVRCRDCSSFLRPEMAELYERMNTEPRPVIYSDPASTAREIADELRRRLGSTDSQSNRKATVSR